MSVCNEGLTELHAKEGSTNRFGGFNCCNKRTDSVIVLPVVHQSLYGDRIVFHNINLQPYENFDFSPDFKFAAGELGPNFDKRNAEKMPAFGFNKRFNMFRKRVFDRETEREPEMGGFNDAPDLDDPVNADSGPRGDEHETSSNIDELFGRAPANEANNGPVCGLFDSCLKPQSAENRPSRASLNEMFRITGAMSSFLEAPEFVDLETIESLVPTKSFANCLGCLRTGFGNGVQKFSSIVSQSSLAPSDVGCLGAYARKLRNLVDADRFSTMATASSLGLRNLYHSLSSLSQNAFAQYNGFDSAHSSARPEAEGYQKFFSVDSTRDAACPNFCAAPRDRTLRPKYKNVRPNTFRLHAVEIHQFVPFPNLPSSRFVNEKTRPEQFKAGSDAYVANCFFNPTTTGPVAPTMGGLMGGAAGYPDLYAMPTKANRLPTQDLSMCVMPLGEGAHGAQAPITLVQ